MIVLLLLIAATVIVLFVSIPDELHRSTSGRSRRSRSASRYPRQVASATLSYVGGLFVMTLIMAVAVSGGLVLVDALVMPIGFMRDALAEFDPAPSRWRGELTEGPQNVSDRHAHWTFAQGGSIAGAKQFQRFLFRIFPIIFIGCGVLSLLAMRFLGGISQIATDEWNRRINDAHLAAVRDQYHHDNRRRR